MKSNSRPFKPRLLLFGLTVVLIAIVAVLGPPERTLGINARVVYLHGVWVWASMAGFFASAITGAIGLAMQRSDLHHWSRALGRTGLVFWATYLPISMWAMQTNWNGLFLAEPRWHMALVFLAGSILLQLGITLIDSPAWASAANVLYFIALIIALVNTENVMHPPAPILTSNALRIQLFFGFLLLLTLAAASQVARWWYYLEGGKTTS